MTRRKWIVCVLILLLVWLCFRVDICDNTASVYLAHFPESRIAAWWQRGRGFGVGVWGRETVGRTYRKWQYDHSVEWTKDGFAYRTP